MATEEEDAAVVTKITFNGGSAWSPIPAPSEILHHACDGCLGGEDCFLHLHGASAWVWGLDSHPSVYSHPNLPGIVMASGNVGPQGFGLGDNGR